MWKEIAVLRTAKLKLRFEKNCRIFYKVVQLDFLDKVSMCILELNYIRKFLIYLIKYKY